MEYYAFSPCPGVLHSEQPIWIERTAVGFSTQALLQCLKQLDIGGDIAVRVVTRMAEVLEGRHTDKQISSADVMQMRDMSDDSPEATKQRITQHSLFVQVSAPRTLSHTCQSRSRVSRLPRAART